MTTHEAVGTAGSYTLVGTVSRNAIRAFVIAVTVEAAWSAASDAAAAPSPVVSNFSASATAAALCTMSSKSVT